MKYITEDTIIRFLSTKRIYVWTCVTCLSGGKSFEVSIDDNRKAINLTCEVADVLEEYIKERK